MSSLKGVITKAAIRFYVAVTQLMLSKIKNDVYVISRLLPCHLDVRRDPAYSWWPGVD